MSSHPVLVPHCSCDMRSPGVLPAALETTVGARQGGLCADPWLALSDLLADVETVAYVVVGESRPDLFMTCLGA